MSERIHVYRHLRSNGRVVGGLPVLKETGQIFDPPPHPTERTERAGAYSKQWWETHPVQTMCAEAFGEEPKHLVFYLGESPNLYSSSNLGESPTCSCKLFGGDPKHLEIYLGKSPNVYSASNLGESPSCFE